MFIRWVVGADHEDHRSLTGLVTEAEQLRKSGALRADEEAILQDHFAWLNKHLPVPPYSRSEWPRHAAA